MLYSKEERRRPTTTTTMPKVTAPSKVINSNEGRYRPTTTTTVPKATVSTNSINTDDGRYRPAATTTVPKVPISPNVVNLNEMQSLPLAATTAPEITACANSIQSSAKGPSFWERAKDTVLGALGKSTASDINTAANLYDLGQGGRDTMARYYLSEYETGLKEAQRALEQMREDGASARDIANQQAIVDDFQRKYDAMSAAHDEQRRTTEAAYGLADDVKSSAEADITHAKEGAGVLGQLLVDTGANWIQMKLDEIKSILLFGEPGVLTYAGRKYGEHTQDARQDGADVRHASLYGAAGAAADARIEKWFDGLNGIYGKDTTSKMMNSFITGLQNGLWEQSLAKAARNDAGEVLESFATDVADQLLKFSYNDKGIGQTIAETEWDRVGRNMLINAIIGILSGDTAFESDK